MLFGNTPKLGHSFKRSAFLSLTICLFACTLCMGHQVKAQVMRLELTVENYFAVYGARPILSESLQNQKGRVYLSRENKADYNGFIIGASENTWLKVSLSAPEALVLDEHNKLPFRIDASFQHLLPENKASAPIPFTGTCALVPTTGNSLLVDHMHSAILPLQTRILFFPSIYIGEVTDGVYDGQIHVRVEYL